MQQIQFIRPPQASIIASIKATIVAPFNIEYFSIPFNNDFCLHNYTDEPRIIFPINHLVYMTTCIDGIELELSNDIYTKFRHDIDEFCAQVFSDEADNEGGY